MNSRERVLRAIHHQPADRVPIDLGGTRQSGIAASTYHRLKKMLGIDTPTRVYDIYQMLAAELLIHKHGIIHGDSNLGNILLFQINEKDPFNSSVEELLEGCRLRPIDFGASFYIDDHNNAKEYYKDYMGHDYTGKDIGKLVTLIDFMNLLECIEECLIQLFNNYPKQLIIDIKHYCMDILKLANEMPLNDLLFPPNLIGGEDIDDWLKTNDPLKHAITNKREPPKFLYEDIPSYRVMEKFFKK